jgi:fermentation-respiration switch protein FrsA (DUF1100 family)
MGVSLGTAHAAFVTEDTHIHGIILENPFTSIPDIVPFLGMFVFDTWNIENALSFTSIPLLILTSEQDEIIPPYMSTTILNAYRGPKQQVILNGSLHGHAGAHPDYLPAVKAWLDEQK